MHKEDKPGNNCAYVDEPDEGLTGLTGAPPRFRSMQSLLDFLEAGVGFGSSMFNALRDITQKVQAIHFGRFRFRRDSTVKGHPGYRIPISGNIDGRHPLNLRRRVDRRNLLRARGLLGQWKYLPRYVSRFGKNGKGDVIRVAIDGLEAAA